MQYEIKGEPTPVVICHVENGETMITESGSMVWMSPNMEMQTTAGGFGKVFGRMFAGENLFQNRYTARGGAGWWPLPPASRERSWPCRSPPSAP